MLIAACELAIHLIARMRTAWEETNAQDRARNLKLLDDLLAEEPAVVALVDDEDRLAVWIAPADSGAAVNAGGSILSVCEFAAQS